MISDMVNISGNTREDFFSVCSVIGLSDCNSTSYLKLKYIIANEADSQARMRKIYVAFFIWTKNRDLRSS